MCDGERYGAAVLVAGCNWHSSTRRPIEAVIWARTASRRTYRRANISDHGVKRECGGQVNECGPSSSRRSASSKTIAAVIGPQKTEWRGLSSPQLGPPGEAGIRAWWRRSMLRFEAGFSLGTHLGSS